MSDSETCCSRLSSEIVESPVLYAGAVLAGSCEKTDHSQLDGHSTIAALDELDSMLQYPCSQLIQYAPCRSVAATIPTSNGVSMSISKAVKSDTKHKSIRDVVKFMPSQPASSAAIMKCMEVDEMKLLLTSCGVKPDGYTKIQCSKQLFALHQSGALVSLREKSSKNMQTIDSCKINATLRPIGSRNDDAAYCWQRIKDGYSSITCLIFFTHL